jgi:hypothetical protein
LRFRFGNSDDTVHGFLGNVAFGIGEGRFKEEEGAVAATMNAFDRPTAEFDGELVQADAITDPVDFDAAAETEAIPTEMSSAPYATEYAVAGWFKWIENSEQENLLFRISSSTSTV